MQFLQDLIEIGANRAAWELLRIQHLAAYFIGQDTGGGACRVKDRKWDYFQIW